MPNPVFYLVTSAKRTFITCPEQQLQIRVYELPGDKPEFTYADVHYFGTTGSKMLAFVATEWTPENIILVGDALRWYSDHHLQEQLKLSLSPPYKM